MTMYCIFSDYMKFIITKKNIVILYLHFFLESDRTSICTRFVTVDHKTIDFSFMPKIIRMLRKDHVP